MTYIPDVTPSGLAAALRDLEIPTGHHVAVLLADGGEQDLGAIAAALAETGRPFFGARFPALIADRKVYESGTLMVTLPVRGQHRLIRDLGQPPEPMPAHEGSVMLFADGLAHEVGTFLASFYRVNGNGVKVFGGGAGSPTLQPGPCLFDASGAYQDAALLIHLPYLTRLGVRHGWERFGTPLLATSTSGNVVHELNWRPAFDVYSEVVAADCGQQPTKDGFFDISKSYPFSLARAGAEPIVRDPIAATEDGSLVCVGEVPENAALQLCRGRPEDLIEAAGKVADDCLAQAPTEVQRAWITDCVSRSIFLGERMSEELDAIADRLHQHTGADVRTRGALTLGEIASMGEGHLEFLNKTCVLATLHENPDAD